MLSAALKSERFLESGYVRLEAPVTWLTLARGIAAGFELPRRAGGRRNALDDSDTQSLATMMGAALSPHHEVFAVRAIWFDKRPGANWKAPWHQDLSVAVADRREADGFGPWSTKAGVVHTQPPTEILESMFAVRLHLDRADESNGALQVVPGSHLHGILTPGKIHSLASHGVQVTADAGDLIVMRPLLLHASSVSHQPCSRRVLHVEYSLLPNPGPLRWKYGITSCRNPAEPRPRTSSCGS